MAAQGEDNTGMVKKQAAAMLELRSRMALLPPAQRRAVEQYGDMKEAWQDFVDKNKPKTFGVLSKGYQLVSSAVTHLQPFFDAGAKAAATLIDAMQKAVDDGALDRLAKIAAPALGNLTHILINIGRTVTRVFGQIGGGSGVEMLQWFEDLTEKWVAWASATEKDTGIQKLIAYAKTEGPGVAENLGHLAASVEKIAKAVAPLAPITVAVAVALSQLVDAVPQDWITALVGGMIAYSAAVKVVAVYQAASTAAQLAWNTAQIAAKAIGAAAMWAAHGVKIVAVTVATGAATAATWLWNAALAAAGWVKQAAAMALFVVQQNALLIAQKVATAAQWLWNAAMTANPIGLIIAAVVALIAVIVWLATKTQFFQTIWKYVWTFMKAVGAWFAGPFANFFVMVWGKIVAFAKGVWNAVKAYFGMWKGLFMSVVAWGVNAVIAITNKFSTFVRWIMGLPKKVSNALSGMWNGLKSGFKSAINWVIGKWNSLSFSIPSFSVLGQTFGGGTIGVPRIPQLAQGGLVRARAGGTLVNVGEGGRDEAVVPLNRAGEFLGGGGDRPIVIQVVGNESDYRRWLAKSLRVKGAIGRTTVFTAAGVPA